MVAGLTATVDDCVDDLIDEQLPFEIQLLPACRACDSMSSL